MIQGRRGTDPSFRRHHLLYRRCNREDLFEGRLIPARIPLDTSVNWSKYSKPWDVIFENPGDGFLQFTVRSLPSNVPYVIPSGQQSSLHVCAPGHKPLEYNYSHSEILTYRKSNNRLERVSKDRVGGLAKKEIRQLLSERAVLLQVPAV